MTQLTSLLGIRYPIIQAPMAGVSTPNLAAAVSEAGALGSIALGTSNAEQARAAIQEVRKLIEQPFSVNLFTHRPAQANPEREARWLEHLRPYFEVLGVSPPPSLREIFTSFLADPAMLDILVSAAPPVVSIHFGLLEPAWIAALHEVGCILMATATSLPEALAIEAAGIDVVVAQGYEAGGHRGIFDPNVEPAIGTLALTRLLASRLRIPVVAAGGIMDGQGIADVLRLGAAGAQLGTAFILCPESSATPHHRQLLRQPEGRRTAVTTAISGRPARGLVNRYFSDLGAPGHPPIPDCPLAYDAAICLHAAAAAQGLQEYSINLAGEGFALSREMPAKRLVETLVEEMIRS